MGRQRLAVALVFCILAMSPLSMVMSRSHSELADKKNYYSPDPNAPPRHHNNPSCQTPSHGGSGGTPPYPTTPSHGGGSGGTPPYPTTPSHGGGSGGTPPSPTTPSQGGGSGYYNTPPTVPLSPNPVPTHPAPLSPLVPLVPPSPTTPNSTPPPTPFIPVDPNTPPFFTGTCSYWNTHPTAIWVLFGYWGTIGQAFGSPATLPFGRNLNLVDALGNTRNDGIGALLREGTASLLNSMVNRRFAFTTQQVRDSFNTAMHSEKTAAAQAKVFQKANEGHIKH